MANFDISIHVKVVSVVPAALNKAAIQAISRIVTLTTMMRYMNVLRAGSPIKVTVMTAIHRGLKAVSFMFMLKSIVGFSIATLALFGVVVPLFGFNPPPVAEGGAAAVGGVIGALLALRS